MLYSDIAAGGLAPKFAHRLVVLPQNYTCELVMRICLSRVAALFGENDGGKSVPAARTELTTTACLLFCH